MIRVVFMGTPAYATTILRAMLSDADIDVPLLVTQEDKPVGRKQTITPPDAKAWVLNEKIDIEIYQPKSLRTQEASEKIASYKPDFILVAAYGKLLPKAILDIAPCINLHASLLPKYRGASPIQATLLAGETYAGVTSMLMEEGLDTGAMLGFLYHLVLPEETSKELFEILANHAATLTLLSLKNFETLAPWKQVSACASHCQKIKKEDGCIDFNQNADVIMRRFQGLHPWPGLFLPSGLKILKMQLVDTKAFHQNSGEICDIQKEGVVINCTQGSLLLQILQPPSKNAMNAVDYIRGKRLSCGDKLA